jgi:hypothetical protein
VKLTPPAELVSPPDPVAWDALLGMTPAVRSGNAVVPAIKASSFTFSSLSDAV